MRVLYFSSVNWNWIKQRPHFISYYMSLHGMDVDYFSVTPLFKQKKGKNQDINANLHIKDQYVLPLASKINTIQYINRIFIKLFLKKGSYETIILTHPLQYQYILKKNVKCAQLIYECMDNIPFFYKGRTRAKMIEEENRICHASDKIITSSVYLKDRLMKEYGIQGEKITVIKNAVDQSFVTQEIKQVKLNHPNLMYLGTISEWIDIESLNVLAKANPNYTIYLVGPVAVEIKKQIEKLSDNIKLLGVIPHEAIKSYILEGDIMLIPFKVSKLIEGVDPVKMYEYLTIRKPVISTYWEELACYKQNKLVYFYNNAEELKEKVESIIKTNENTNVYGDNTIDLEFANKNSWEMRMYDYIRVINRPVNRHYSM